MPEEEKSIPDLIIEILNREGKMFMTMKRFAFLTNAKTKRILGIHKLDSAEEMREILEPKVEDKLIFTQKGSSIYILIPCDPEELILHELIIADRPKSPLEIAHVMPFTKKECKVIINELIRRGEVQIFLNDLLEPRLSLADKKSFTEQNNNSSMYKPENFIEAFKSLDNGRIFVKISSLRRKLNWPREVFDNMLRELRDKKIIQLHVGDTSLMTSDEVQDCFIDENNFRMGTVTLHAN